MCASVICFHKVLGALRLIDSGESDSKIIVIREEEADSIKDIASLEIVKPGKRKALKHVFTSVWLVVLFV